MAPNPQPAPTALITTDGSPDAEATKRDLQDKIVALYNSLALVRVSTVVADVELKVRDSDHRLDVSPSDLDKEKTIITQSDLIEGDIVTIISTGLENNAELRQFHAEQVAAAVQVVPNNLKTLVDLFQQVVSVIKS
jgi:hypothetical protein